MPLARPRFTIRRLMVAVAISAVGSWAWVHYSRADPFEKILLSQIGGVIIAWVLMIGACASVAALIGRSSSPPK